MTKKHFLAIANQLKLHAKPFLAKDTYHELCARMAGEFQEINPRFDFSTFMMAAQA